MMRSTKSVVNLVGDWYLAHNPNFFYRDVVFFYMLQTRKKNQQFLSFYDLFVQQIDVKLLEEQSYEPITRSHACLFFKN